MFVSRLRLLGILFALATGRVAALTITAFNVGSTEDFDSLATSTGSVVPAGWEFSETGSGANTTYGAGTGSSSTGNTYSFGATSATDRAWGAVRTSSVSSAWGTVITNLTGDTISLLDVAYFGEQWRLGATGRVDRLDFAYSLDATSIATGVWIDFDALDFVGGVTTGVTGALDGNDAANRLLVSGSISGLSLAPGASLWLRWSDFEATGSDDGLSIDDFVITATQSPAQNVPDQISLGVILALSSVLLLTRVNVRSVASAVFLRLMGGR
jgi:hypothetical protein